MTTPQRHSHHNYTRLLSKAVLGAFLAVLLLAAKQATAFCPVVICPGFGNDSIDYVAPLEQPEEVGLKSVLARRGFDPSQIYIVPVQRSDWIRVAGGLFDIPGFYLGTAKPTGPGYGWYVKRLKETVDLAYDNQAGESTSGKQKVLVIGHSAGGWLARAAMADGLWSEGGAGEEPPSPVRTSDRIRCLVTMGAIHAAPEDESTCVTRGALGYTAENYPGAFLKDEGIGYVSIGGSAIVGDERKDDEKDADTDQEGSEADEFYKQRGEGNSNRVAFTSYKAVSGNGNLIGDGVVPLDWTQLEGSRQIVLPDVLHSINEVGTTFPTDRWYGSEKVIDRWLPAVMEEADLAPAKNGNAFDFAGGLQQWASNLIQKN